MTYNPDSVVGFCQDQETDKLEIRFEELLPDIQTSLNDAEKTKCELDAVMQLGIDKWLEGDELKDNPATRAATAREKALCAIESAEKKLAIAVEALKNIYEESKQSGNHSLGHVVTLIRSEADVALSAIEKPDASLKSRVEEGK